MLSLQWEPEIIAVAVMYLAGRLCKFDIQEWTAKQSSRRWWEQFVQDVPVELLEGAPHEAMTHSCCSYNVLIHVLSDFVSTKKTTFFLHQTSATRSWICTPRETSPSLSRYRRRSVHLFLRPLLLQSHRDNHQPPILLPHRQRRLPLREVALHASSNAHM